MKTIPWVTIGLSLAARLWAQEFETTASVGLVKALASNPSTSAQPLSPATLARIAGMTSLFNGKTLEGWIQAPPAPLTFSANDLFDAAGFARKLRDKPEALSRFLNEQLDAVAQTAITTTQPAGGDKELGLLLVKNLNRMIGTVALYDEARFRGIRLRPVTEALRRKKPQGQELMRLNRMLLEDAYPAELVTSPMSAWTVKDGAIVSQGAGRGVLYTKSDYSHYRIILTVRHVSGKPDHKPGILVFCMRPAEGEKELDALGGIQFQVPTGSHWDYRPGHNNSGSAFTNPTKTSFDFHQWHQVEILVNAQNGTARMAVAQPVGTRAIENADFADPGAGKSGPIALQMHNSGLFDEYKDIKIELDPAEDRLLTVESVAPKPGIPE